MFRLRKFSEEDFDKALIEAGGRRAHPDAHKRDLIGADYVLGNTVIELKLLQEEGLEKSSRQSKIASLFSDREIEDRPVIVLDRAKLTTGQQRKYDNIMEGPIKSAVSKARKQLPISRGEIPNINCSVLLLINDGYTALDHDALLRMATNRIKQDTSSIDAVVVAGSYIHGDGFEMYSLWPMSCEQINANFNFHEFEKLKAVWNKLAEQFMTEVVLGIPEDIASKTIALDLGFEREGVKFVMPTQRIGKTSDFYKHGRPRNENANNFSNPVATVFPIFTRENWENIVSKMQPHGFPVQQYGNWENEQKNAEKNENPLNPLVTIDVDQMDVKAWCEENAIAITYESISNYVMDQFNNRIQLLLESASELTDPSGIMPSSFILAITEQIGQSIENDISHIVQYDIKLTNEYDETKILSNANIPKHHAIRLAAAYALKNNINSVYWLTEDEYLWF